MEMLPEVASKSAAVKDAAPLVEPSAAAFWIESVEPENVRGEDTVSVCIAEVPLPTRSPVSVVEPVPPFATPSVPLIVESERQVPLIEKQPAVRLAPFASVDVPEGTHALCVSVCVHVCVCVYVGNCVCSCVCVFMCVFPVVSRICV